MMISSGIRWIAVLQVLLFFSFLFMVTCDGSSTKVDDESLSRWEKVRANSIEWTVNGSGGRSPSMNWTVEYTYIVDGKTFKGININARTTSIKVGYGTYPIDMIARLNEIEWIWYDPQAPERSGVFKGRSHDVSLDLREAYVKLTAQAKAEGRWP